MVNNKQVFQPLLLGYYLLLAIEKDRRRLKKHFNEEFKGFHFYDISFCFENFKEGVKIGVTTKISLTHKSIGMVNKQWEKNKLFFEALYEKELPAIPETEY